MKRHGGQRNPRFFYFRDTIQFPFVSDFDIRISNFRSGRGQSSPIYRPPLIPYAATSEVREIARSARAATKLYCNVFPPPPD